MSDERAARETTGVSAQLLATVHLAPRSRTWMATSFETGRWVSWMQHGKSVVYVSRDSASQKLYEDLTVIGGSVFPPNGMRVAYAFPVSSAFEIFVSPNRSTEMRRRLAAAGATGIHASHSSMGRRMPCHPNARSSDVRAAAAMRLAALLAGALDRGVARGHAG